MPEWCGRLGLIVKNWRYSDQKCQKKFSKTGWRNLELKHIYPFFSKCIFHIGFTAAYLFQNCNQRDNFICINMLQSGPWFWWWTWNAPPDISILKCGANIWILDDQQKSLYLGLNCPFGDWSNYRIVARFQTLKLKNI